MGRLDELRAGCVPITPGPGQETSPFDIEAQPTPVRSGLQSGKNVTGKTGMEETVTGTV